jgi:hypothetical protein
MGWFRRLRGSFGSRLQDDIDDELLFHIEARSHDYVRGGMAPDDAREAALDRFGNLAAARMGTRAMDTIGWLDRHPGRPMAALLLVVGIGANAAILPGLFAAGAAPDRLAGTVAAPVTNPADASAESWRTPACQFALFALQTWGGMPRTLNHEDIPGSCPVPPYTGVGNVGTLVAW